MIALDIARRSIDLDVAPEILKQRLAHWQAPQARYGTGVFAKYAALVGSASDGAITSVAR
jgi:dihydroxy-acid dehydratase